MPVQMIVFTGIRFLHDLATAVWIGGLIAMALAVVPAAKSLFGLSPQTRRLLLAVQSRLRVLVYVSIVALITTGALMSRRSPQFTGVFSWATPYSAALAWKHLLVIAMVAIALVRGLTFGRTAGQAPGLVRGQGADLGPAQGQGAAAGAAARQGQAGMTAAAEQPGPGVQTASPGQPGPAGQPGARERVGMLLLYLNVLLGIGVLVLSALSATLRASPAG